MSGQIIPATLNEPAKNPTPPGTGAGPAKKKARRATGTLRKWTADEEIQLRELVASLGQQKAKRADFDRFAEKLNAWARKEGVTGSERTGYAVEQRWQLYLRPEATRAAKAAQPAPPSNLPVVPPLAVAQDGSTPSTAAAPSATPSSSAADKRKAGAGPEAPAPTAAALAPAPKAAGKRKAGAATPDAPQVDAKICWEPSETLSDFEALAMEVAEHVSLQAMSRMCRKGMGFKRTDDPRLRGAEHAIDPADEIERLVRALAPVEAAAAPLRPASLWAVHRALAAAWHEWRETDLATAHRDYEPSGCLGEPWHQMYEAPATYGLAARLGELWMRTLTELWDAGHTAPPPPTLVNELVAMDAFMAQVRKLDAKYEAARAFFLQAAEQLKAAAQAKAQAEKAAREKVRSAYVAEAAKERKRAHKAYLAAYKALPLSTRRRTLFVSPGGDEDRDGVCWQCCGATGHVSRAVQLTAGEETSPLETMALPSGVTEELYLPPVGEYVSFCIECYEERCEGLGLEPSEPYSDDEDDYW